MPKKSTKEYNAVRGCYIRYLEYYKKLNHGSLDGATTFDKFYIYKTYVIRYMEPTRMSSHSYK